MATQKGRENVTKLKSQENAKTNKELRQLVARAGNKIYRRKHWRKATHKQKQIMKELKKGKQ